MYLISENCVCPWVMQPWGLLFEMSPSTFLLGSLQLWWATVAVAGALRRWDFFVGYPWGLWIVNMEINSEKLLQLTIFEILQIQRTPSIKLLLIIKKDIYIYPSIQQKGVVVSTLVVMWGKSTLLSLLMTWLCPSDSEERMSKRARETRYPPKFNIDTKHDVFYMYLLSNIAILVIQVSFRGCVLSNIW